MKKEFNAEMKVVRFGAEDMIVTSGGGKTLTLSNTFDNLLENNTAIFDNVSYHDTYNLVDALRAHFGPQISDGTWISNGEYTADLYEIFVLDRDYYDGSDFDGTYTYDGMQFNKQ